MPKLAPGSRALLVPPCFGPKDALTKFIKFKYNKLAAFRSYKEGFCYSFLCFCRVLRNALVEP